MSDLTEGEMQIMRVLWEAEEDLKPADIIARMENPLKNSAVRSFLAVLLNKGHVTRQRQGKAFFYRARTRQGNAFRTMLRRMADAFCGGSTEALMLRLMREEKWSDAQLERLRRMAQAEPSAEGGQPKGPKPRESGKRRG